MQRPSWHSDGCSCLTADLSCDWRTLPDLFSSQLQSSSWFWDYELCLPFRKSHSHSSYVAFSGVSPERQRMSPQSVIGQDVPRSDQWDLGS